MRLFYTVLLICLLPFILLRLMVRGFRDNRYWQNWNNRFGNLQIQNPQPVIWLHAVSVGEVRAASVLLKRLIEHYPDYQYHITTTTPTGAEMVQRLLGGTLSHSYYPYDLPWVVNRFLDRLQPSLVLIIETEIWPNLFHACHQRHIPLCLLNARLSASSFNRYRKLAQFTKQTLGHLALVTAKNASDRERFIKLGMDEDRVVCPGNLKYDIEFDKTVFDKAAVQRSRWEGGRKVWVAGSTHPGEEEIVLGAHKTVLEKYPGALLILVPRHPERASEIVRLCNKAGLTHVLSSEAGENAPTSTVIIGDRIGELPQFYAVSDIAFVGGSLVPHGGQNPLEPAVVAVPILMGPSISNFKDVYQKLNDAGAVFTINDGMGLAMQLNTWFKDPDSAMAVGQLARRVVEQNKGAVNRTIDYLQPYIE